MILFDRLYAQVMTGVSVALALSFAGVAFYDWVRITNRDHDISVLTYRIEDPKVGYLAQIGACRSQRLQLQSEINVTNEKVAELWALSEKATRDAQAAVNAADQARVTAERRAAQILASAPRPGETQCEAAFRTIQESVQ